MAGVPAARFLIPGVQRQCRIKYYYRGGIVKQFVLCLAVVAAALGGTIVPELENILANSRPDEMVAVVVHTSLQADLSQLPPNTTYDEKISYLQYVAERAQRGILDYLAATDAKDVRSFWLESRIALSATPAVIRALAAREDVDYVIDDFTVTLEAAPSVTTVTDVTDMQQWNITKVSAPDCWAAGYNGAGVVVGNIDTGVYVSHSVFGSRWRSTNGWFDGVNGQTSPYDDYGHGTHTMGTAVGALGYGVAPGATFICAKAFNSQGSGQSSWISACLDWMAGTGKPDVCFNSWGTSDRTSTYWFNSFNNLRSLGIVCVASIGNAGPSGSTSLPPGSYPICIGVGATTSSDAIASYSSRGPAPNQSPWTDTQYWPRPDWNLINPGIAAPGSGVVSSLPNGGYGSMDGTSMACPHVGGAAAILLQKKPTLTHNEIFVLLTENADKPSGGGPYPNNNYGWGRLNCKAALDAVTPSNKPNLVLTRTAVTGDNNGNGRFDPGETGNLITYIRNASTVGATAVSGRLRTSSSYLTITDSTANYGNIAGNDSANNLSDPFRLSVSSGCPQGHTAAMTLFLSCAESSFTRSFNLVIGEPPVQGQLLMDHDTGYCKLTVSCQGSIGYDLPPADAGSGFCYPKTGSSQLFYGSFAVGNSANYVADRHFSNPASGTPNTDLVPVDSLRPVSPPSAGDEHFRGSYSDAGHPSAKGLTITQNSYQVAAPGYDDFVVLVFDIQNNGASAVNGLYTGVFADFDIGSAPTANICSSDVARRFTFMRQSSSANPTVGVKILDPHSYANLAAIDHARYVYPDSAMTDGMKWRFLNATINQPNSNRAYDWSLCTSVGPFDLPAGARQRVAFAFCGGTSTSQARAHADSAQSWYDNTIGSAEPQQPVALRCLRVEPNPFSGHAEIHYQLNQAGRVRISAIDVAGREVACLADEVRPAGELRLTWCTHDLARGVYFLKIETPDIGSRYKVVKH
ncbi:MAG: S8 family serine peptidase [candidate division WOR-3 bacterium]